MRTLTSALVLALIASLAAPAGAATYKKKHKRYSNQYERSYAARVARSSSEDGYYEHDANKLPFGSQRWWDQMQREGRLGGDAPN
jgi:hypothetical protein